MHAVHKALELVLYVAINKSLKLNVEIEQKSDFEHYININGDKNCIFQVLLNVFWTIFETSEQNSFIKVILGFETTGDMQDLSFSSKLN